MPNWSQNIIAFKGEESKVLEMLNDALVNSKVKKREKFADAVNALERYAKHKAVNNGKIVNERGLQLRTFLPMPDTFMLYDTTNYPDKFEEATKEQRRKYGVVGWYDYNLMTLGTKWDAELAIESSHSVDGTATIVFFCETAWSYPEAWMRALGEKYGLQSFILTKEEGGFYYFYGTLKDKIDLLGKEEELYKQFIDGEGEEDYEGFDEASGELWEDSIADFYEYMESA